VVVVIVVVSTAAAVAGIKPTSYYEMGTGVLPEGKAAGARDYLPQSSAEVKNE
jgi:hypothetical protein